MSTPSPFLTLSDIPVKEPLPGFRLTSFRSESMTMALWDVDEGAALSEHHHPHEQVAVALEGRFELTVGGETRVLEPGVSAVIPSNVPHSGRALTPCRLLDVFHPVREDL